MKAMMHAIWGVIILIILGVVAGCFIILYSLWNAMTTTKGGDWSTLTGIVLGIVIMAIMGSMWWLFFRVKPPAPPPPDKRDGGDAKADDKKEVKKAVAAVASARDYSNFWGWLTLTTAILTVGGILYFLFVTIAEIMHQPVHDTQKVAELIVDRYEAKKASAPISTGLLAPGEASQPIKLKKGGYADSIYTTLNSEDERRLLRQKTVVRYKIDGKWEEHWKSLDPNVKNWTTTQYIQELQFVNRTDVPFSVEVRLK